jgi:hypothetical protein
MQAVKHFMTMFGIHKHGDKNSISAVEQLYVEHISAWGISYGTQEEYSFRLAQFERNEQKIQEINSDSLNTF